MQPHGLEPTGLLCPCNFPGKNTGVGCHFLLQGFFWPKDWTHISYIASMFCITGSPGKPSMYVCMYVYTHTYTHTHTHTHTHTTHIYMYPTDSLSLEDLKTPVLIETVTPDRFRLSIIYILVIRFIWFTLPIWILLSLLPWTLFSL